MRTIFRSFSCFNLFILLNLFFCVSYAQTSKSIDANGNIISDNITSSSLNKPGPVAPNLVVVCVCPPIAGVTCSITGTTNSGTSTAAAAGCPHVGYCDPGANNPWSSAAGTGTLQYMFSAPVSNATLRANSVNSNDFATVSASGGTGGTLSITGVVCMGVAGLVIGPLSVAASYGGVRWTVNSTGSYTNVALLNTGAQSGWVATCPTAITVAVLPIELVSFTGICTMDNKVDIKWKTATEKQNDYFTVERSKDGFNWEILNKINGSENSNTIQSYSYTDREPLNGQNYYRLKQTDRNSDFKYSELITVENCNTNIVSTLRCYPNPNNGSFTIQSNANETILITNELGTEVKNIELNSENNFTSVIDLPRGVYFVSSGASKQKVVVIK